MRQTGWVPDEQQSGWKPDDQPTQFERDRAPDPNMDTSGGVLNRIVRGVGRGLNNAVEGIYNTVAHPIDTAKSMYNNAATEIDAAGKEPSTIGKIADYGAAIPGLGPLGKNLGERAAQGDYAGAISEGVTTAAAPSVAKEGAGLVGKGIRAASPTAGRLWDAKAPIARGVLSKVAGPEAANAVFPKPVEPLPGVPEGATTSHSGIGPPIAPPVGAGSSTSTGPQVQMNVGSPISPPGFEGQAPQGGVPLVPEPRSLFPGEDPNYMASTPREELPDLAQQRKPGAGKQMQQIGKTILYKPRPTIGTR